jgi:transmembrane sensor
MRDLVEKAMVWLERSQSPSFTPDQRQQFEHWLQEDVRHRVAHTVALKAKERIDHLRNMRPLDGPADPDLLLSPEHTPRPIGPLSGPGPERPNQSQPTKMRLVSIAAIGVTTLCALTVAGWYASDRLSWVDYATHVGGKHTTPLPDGTSVTLNTDSDLRVRMTPEGRELELTRGEAVIKAAPDARRPFKLIVGKTVIQTAAAEFDVRKRESGQVEVVVSHGRIAAESTEAPLARPFDRSPPTQSVISAGYMASIRPGDVQVSLLDADEQARKTAWLHDVLDFRGETLAEAAGEFNRYNGRQIVIDDPQIADRRVGGVFVDTDPESFVAALGPTMDVHATTVGGEAGPGYGTIRLTSAQARR